MTFVRRASAVLLLVAASAGAGRRAGAQELPKPVAPRVVTLPEAIAYARAHEPTIRAAQARVAAEEQAARIPRGQWLPSVGVTAQLFAASANNTTASFVGGAPYVEIPRISSGTVTAGGTMRPYASSLAAAGVVQEVFDFGRIAAQSAAADALVEVTRRRLGARVVDVDFGVAESYYAVVAARGVVRAAEGALLRARAHRDLAAAGVTAGMRPPVDLTRAEADLTRFEVGRVRAEAGLVVAQSGLAAAMGAPEAAVDAAESRPASPKLQPVEQAVQQAMAKSPRVLEAESRLRAQEQRVTAIGALLRPNLTATGSLSLVAGGAPPSGTGEPAHGSGFLPDVPNWDVGLVLTWPIFNGPIHAQKRAARAGVEVEREELAAVRFGEGAAARRAYVGVQVAEAALPALGRAAAAARANYEQVDARFKTGLATSVELSDAEALRSQAEVELTLGAFDVARARLGLGRLLAEEP